MTDIYVRALHIPECLSRFLSNRYRDDVRAGRPRNGMDVWDRRREDWTPVDVHTPGLPSLRPHHLDRLAVMHEDPR